MAWVFFVFDVGRKAIHCICENTHVAKEPQGQCLIYVLTSNNSMALIA